MNHNDLAEEMGSLVRLASPDRSRLVAKRRSQQLRKWNEYDKNQDKESLRRKREMKVDMMRNMRSVHFSPNVMLLQATCHDDFNEVKRLLESGVDADSVNDDRLTALHQCCIDNSLDIACLLLSHKASINSRDTELWSPLHAAAVCGHTEMCRRLIDRGAELLAVNSDGNMPYDICENKATLDYIEMEMTKRGITQLEIDKTRSATEHLMLSDLMEVDDGGGDLEMADNVGATPLHIAAANGYMRVAEFLLENGVQVDIGDHDSWQSIHAATHWAQPEIMELLVEHGADLDARTRKGETSFDVSMDHDIKQKVLELKEMVESKRAIRQRDHGSQKKHRTSVRSASIRRGSMKGDRDVLFKREHKEEALHFGHNLITDQDCLTEAEDEREHTKPVDVTDVSLLPSGVSSQCIADSGRSTPRESNHGGSVDFQDSVRLTSGLTDVTTSASRPPTYTTVITISAPQQLSRESLLDSAVQTMFLENVNSGRRSQVRSAPNLSNSGMRVVSTEGAAKNGHSNPSHSVHRHSDGQLQRFVSPDITAPIGNKKNQCCVIL